MAGYPNKIIINSRGNDGMSKLIKSDLDTLMDLGNEILGNGLLADTMDLRDEMKQLCADHYKAQMVYHEGLKALIEKTAERIDKKLATP